jgi:hypothetical protein
VSTGHPLTTAGRSAAPAGCRSWIGIWPAPAALKNVTTTADASRVFFMIYFFSGVVSMVAFLITVSFG